MLRSGKGSLCELGRQYIRFEKMATLQPAPSAFVSTSVFILALASWLLAAILILPAVGRAEESWPQHGFDSEHSGNAPAIQLDLPLGLQAAIPLTDAVFTSPAIDRGRIFVLDGSGVLFCVDAKSLEILWKFVSDPSPLNCNNYSSPAIAGEYVHFGTTTGKYFVLKVSDGSVVQELSCREPIFACPVVGNHRVYFTTLGSQVYALSPAGEIEWTWDYVREVLKFEGDRWSGQAWLKHQQGGRVTWREQFLCSRNIALHKQTLVLPAGGSIVWLHDEGPRAKMLGGYAPHESPATLGLSLDDEGTVYRQWFRRDNTGSVEVLRVVDQKPVSSSVQGTETDYHSDPSMSFSAVSIRDGAVYRCRPEEHFGLCVHANNHTTPLGDYPSIAPPILVGDKAIVSCLDGRLALVPLNSDQSHWVFKTPHGRPITASAAAANGQVAFGGEDGYLYILGPNGNALPPEKPLDLASLRSPLTSRFAAPQYNWDTHFANQANTNRTMQNVQLPLAMRWIRRCEGTIKHLSTVGGGRVYTHTAEGLVMAVEQETGRLLWRTYYPGVHVSFTTPAYHNERLYVPQAGLGKCRLRCLDAATGQLVWEVPFMGSPSWNRQVPPLIHDGLIFYQFSSGKYTGRNWLFEHQSTYGFGPDQKPLVKAWDLNTGREAWSLDFSEYGQGGDDAGMCLADDTLFYSCYFGDKAAKGVTAAINPQTGSIKWHTTKYAVHAGCAPSVHDGRLYLGGYNAIEGKTNRVWCLDTADGELIWKSDPLERAIHVVTVAGDRLFTHAQYRQGYLLNADSGKVLCELTEGYRCTRFTMDGNYLLGPNMDVIDTANENRLISTGPAVDVLQCVGAQISNGRLFYTANGSGLQLSMNYGDEAATPSLPWRRKPPHNDPQP